MPTTPLSKAKDKPNGDPNWKGIAELCTSYTYSRDTLLPVHNQGDNQTLFRKAMCASPDTDAYKNLLTIFIEEATQLTWLIQGTDQFRQIWESFPNHQLPLADTLLTRLTRLDLNKIELEQRDINLMKAEITGSVNLIFEQPKRQIPEDLERKIVSYLYSP